MPSSLDQNKKSKSISKNPASKLLRLRNHLLARRELQKHLYTAFRHSVMKNSDRGKVAELKEKLGKEEPEICEFLVREKQLDVLLTLWTESGWIEKNSLTEKGISPQFDGKNIYKSLLVSALTESEADHGSFRLAISRTSVILEFLSS